MLKHLVGQNEDNTIDALKELLGVTALEVVLCESMDDFYYFLPREPEADLPPEEVQVQ